MGRTQAEKKASTKISSDVENRIVAISLQNPEFGAKRLAPLLQHENISVSASKVYTILKRNGLQTREKRLLANETQQKVSMPEPPVLDIPVPEQEPLPQQVITKEKALPSPIPPTPQVVVKPIAKRSNVLVHLNILLFAMIVFSGFNTVQNISTARKEPEVKSQVFRPEIKREPSAQPLKDYGIIWKRTGLLIALFLFLLQTMAKV